MCINIKSYVRHIKNNSKTTLQILLKFKWDCVNNKSFQRKKKTLKSPYSNQSVHLVKSFQVTYRIENLPRFWSLLKIKSFVSCEKIVRGVMCLGSSSNTHTRIFANPYWDFNWLFSWNNTLYPILSSINCFSN